MKDSHGWKFLKWCGKGDWFKDMNGFLPENDYFNACALRHVLDNVDVNDEHDLWFVASYINQYIDFVCMHSLQDAWRDFVKSQCVASDALINDIAVVRQREREWRNNLNLFVDDILYYYPLEYEDYILGGE